jgi:hypothetical protein
VGEYAHLNSACSLGLSATSQQYFSLRTNQPPATSQQYSSLRTNQHQPSATSQPNRLRLLSSPSWQVGMQNALKKSWHAEKIGRAPPIFPPSMEKVRSCSRRECHPYQPGDGLLRHFRLWCCLVGVVTIASLWQTLLQLVRKTWAAEWEAYVALSQQNDDGREMINCYSLHTT